MKNIRNKTLQNKLNKLGIKDIGLNFDQGSVLVFSDDELTDTILNYGEPFIYGVASFSQWSIDLWIDEIVRIFDDAMKHYEDSKNWNTVNSDGSIRIKLR